MTTSSICQLLDIRKATTKHMYLSRSCWIVLRKDYKEPKENGSMSCLESYGPITPPKEEQPEKPHFPSPMELNQSFPLILGSLNSLVIGVKLGQKFVTTLGYVSILAFKTEVDLFATYRAAT
ncbi:unnamed protein product [Prunus brigantina]